MTRRFVSEEKIYPPSWKFSDVLMENLLESWLLSSVCGSRQLRCGWH